MSVKLLKSGKVNVSKLDKDAREQYQDLKKVTKDFTVLTPEDEETAQELAEYIKQISPEAFEADEPKKKAATRKKPAAKKAALKPSAKPGKQEKGEKPEKEEQEKQPAPSPAKKVKSKLSRENCGPLIGDLKKLVEKHSSGRTRPAVVKPVKRRPLATVVSENIVSTIKRVIEQEKRSKGVEHIKKNMFERTIQKGKEFLLAIKKDSGGISSDNESMIAGFESQIREILKQFETK